jgi:Ca2+-binding RTX toxin-like protein
VGDAGNDVLIGGGGDDKLIGSNSINRGQGEVDLLEGGAGRDRFILGSAAVHYNALRQADYAQIKDLSKGDVIELARGKYRAIRDGNGFNLYVLGSRGRKDLIADVITPRRFKQLPSGNFSITPNQTIAKIFYGTTEA